jgi:hypothetical protein
MSETAGDALAAPELVVGEAGDAAPALAVANLEPPPAAAVAVEESEEEEDEDQDDLHIGNLIGIMSDAYGYTVGRVVYRDLEMLRIVPQEASDRAVEFPLTDGGVKFIPDLGVTSVEIMETQESPYYVDFLGARIGEMLEFFTVDGAEAAPVGVIEEIQKSPTKDNIKLTDGRVLKFRGIGPKAPIAVIRVRTAVNAAAAVEEGVPAEAATPAAAAARQADILALLRSVLPSATVEVVPTAERSYPDSMQREDMFQDLLAAIPAKQRTNPRRIRFIEREVDLAVSLKNKSLVRDGAGRVAGLAPNTVTTVGGAVTSSKTALPAAIPVVEAARVLNLEDMSTAMAFKAGDVYPRVHSAIEAGSEELANLYLDGALPAAIGRNFYGYTYDLMTRDQVTMMGEQGGAGWTADQDIIRTAGLGAPVQGLSKGLPSRDDEEAPMLSLAFLISDVEDRYMRALAADTRQNLRTGETYVSAPSDPSKVVGYVMLPPKAALALRPPTRPGDLPTALLYSAALQDDNLPTIARTLADLYAPTEEASPLNAWTLDVAAAAETPVAGWLSTVLKYAVHPIDSQGPRTPRLMGLLDTLGLGETDLSPPVADVINKWVADAQRTWRDLLVARRKAIQVELDKEVVRTFQSVTGDDSPLWPALRGAASLAELLEDINRRNPAISGAPTVTTASLLTEAQGDATPIVWSEIAKLDGRDIGIDPVAAAAALTASRSYILRRKALRDIALLSLRAEPEVNTCPHAARLEAIRNTRDVLTRSRLLRDFIEEYQGGREGDWMTCTLCRKSCVCYHELMELEAIAQPARMDAIQKQILIRFGGERYEGKVVCKNCGQPLQDIDYDEHVEFDDDGRPIVSRSVLTEEQMEEPTETTWKKATADLAPAVTFATEAQRYLGEALQTILERSGLQVAPSVIQQIVRYADLYVTSRSPPEAVYNAWRAKQLTAASTKIKVATGAGGISADVPTYAASLDQLRVSALTALTAIALQTADPTITVNNAFPLCKFGRGGWPLDPGADPKAEGTALSYVSCAVASIAKDTVPWRNVSWAGDTKLESRTKKVVQVATAAVQIILNVDAKGGALAFTPEIRTALTKAQTDLTAARERSLVSLKDQLPVGFRPEPFPVAPATPALERDPVPDIEAALAAGTSTAEMIGPVATATRAQSIAAISGLHASVAAAVDAMPQKPAGMTDGNCCPVTLEEVEAGALRGRVAQPQLLTARKLLRGGQPYAVNAGTHLWPEYETDIPPPVEQVVEESVFFKLFLKYCYRGPQIGELHEFSVGNICRQCGLALGKPIDLIDFGKEGAGILAAQQGDLLIEVTPAAFEALSDAVRRRKILTERAPTSRAPWRAGLEQLIAAANARTDLGEEDGSKALAAVLTGVMEAMDAGGVTDGSLDEVARAELWAPLSAYLEGLRADIDARVGPRVPRTAGKIDSARAREMVTAFDMLEKVTADPFIEGPRVLQEYWCAKTEAAGSAFAITKVNGARWFKISKEHSDRLARLMTENSMWYGGDVTESMMPVLRRIAVTLGPLLRVWMRSVRPAQIVDGPWSKAEAQMVLRALVMQGWRDATSTASWMYREVAAPADREATVAGMANWTRALMAGHVKQQFMRYSNEEVKRIMQQRSELERTSVVEEFQAIKDDDQRAAELIKKQLRIGRWGTAAKGFGKYDPDLFEFENEQRHRMGIVEAPVDPVLLAGAAPPAAEDFGLGGGGGPEDGYDANQGADGDDY